MRAILPSSLPTQPRSGSGQTQLIQSLQNWKILQKSNNQIFDVFLSIPVAEPNKAQMRFKSQNTIITVSVSEHSVSLTRVCVSKYKILDTRRFRELLARPPAATRQSPAWPSWAPGVSCHSCHKLPQLDPARLRKQRVTRGGMPRYYEQGLTTTGKNGSKNQSH